MPFISERDSRQRLQTTTPYVDLPEADFGDVFAASVGLVIDEELSISSELNREGWRDRQRKVKQMIADGKVNGQKYQDMFGRFDYNQLAKDLNDPTIKTDATLTKERNELLKKRREYGQGVIERGSGLAQFLGSANGYMLDPINIALMPVATANVSTKSLSIAGRALLTARNEALLATAAELAIQPLVYQHKHDIESPYSEMDAILAIGTAATGAFVLGGAVGGISGYVKKVRGETEKLIELEPDKNSGEIQQTLSNLDRLSEALAQSPQVDTKQIELDFIDELKTRLLAESSSRLSRGERKKIKAKVQRLQKQLKEVDVDVPDFEATPSKSKRRAKKAAQKIQAAEVQARRLEISEQIEALNTQLEASRIGELAEANLSRLEQGLMPDEFQKELDLRINDAIIDQEQEFLFGLENHRVTNNEPSVTPEQYQVPDDQAPPKPQTATTTSRQRELLNQTGMSEAYDDAMEKFNRLDQPMVPDADNNLVDAKKVMEQTDEQLDALEEVLVCTYG